MIFRLQNGDTIQGSKYRREGVQAQQYQKRKQQQARTLPHSEMKPTLRKKTTVREKLQGKKDQYSFSPRIIGLSGADPVGKFIIEGAALSPLATNAEIRKHLADQLGHQPTYEELNTYINSLTEDDVVNL